MATHSKEADPAQSRQLADARRVAQQAATDLAAACGAPRLRLSELDRVARHASLMVAELRIAIRVLTIRRRKT